MYGTLFSGGGVYVMVRGVVMLLPGLIETVWKQTERLIKIPLQKGLQSNVLICTLSAKLFTDYFYVQL